MVKLMFIDTFDGEREEWEVRMLSYKRCMKL